MLIYFSVILVSNIESKHKELVNDWRIPDYNNLKELESYSGK
jgi:hypothetical protein